MMGSGVYYLSLGSRIRVRYHELPTDSTPETREDEDVGLTIWRLLGGKFMAVRRFSGGRRGNERELPMMYTEMDGRFVALNNVKTNWKPTQTDPQKIYQIKCKKKIKNRHHNFNEVSPQSM